MTTPCSNASCPSLPYQQCIQSTERNFPMKKKFVTTYTRNTLHEKTELLQKRQISIGGFGIPLCKLL